MDALIKTKNHDFLMDYMEASDVMASDLPDGAWFAFMEQSGEEYILDTRDRFFRDGNDVAHYYIKHKPTSQEQERYEHERRT